MVECGVATTCLHERDGEVERISVACDEELMDDLYEALLRR